MLCINKEQLPKKKKKRSGRSQGSGKVKAVRVLRGRDAPGRSLGQGWSQEQEGHGTIRPWRSLGRREVSGSQRAGHRPGPHLLTFGPADHEGLALAALGRAPQPPQPVRLGCAGERPLPEGAAGPVLQPVSQVCGKTAGLGGLVQSCPRPAHLFPALPGSRSSKSSEDSVPVEETFTSCLGPGPGVRGSQRLGLEGSWRGSKAKRAFLVSRTTHSCPWGKG